MDEREWMDGQLDKVDKGKMMMGDFIIGGHLLMDI